MERAIPVLGLAVLVGIAWLLSDRRKAIDWRILAWGLGLQVLFGWVALRTTAGRATFAWLGARVTGLLDYSQEGARFVFGNLVDNPAIGYVFALKVLPTIVFFSAFMSVLYHLRVLQVVVRAIGLALRRLMRVSGAEAFSAAANIFVGQTEAPFVIKPFLPRMTSSEVFCVMTGGFATVAGGVMAAYIFMFKDHPTFGRDIAAHLIARSASSAPAASCSPRSCARRPSPSRAGA
jgi:CNT family concentrative nucleoside transporter